MVKITAILLAAGLSSRMGTDKLFLPYKGKPIIRHVFDAVSATPVQELIVVVSDKTRDVVKKLLGDKAQIVLNPDFKKGMTTSIQAGVRGANQTDGYMICLGDLPRINTQDYQQIIQTFQDHYQQDEKLIVVPFYQGTKGNPVVFSAVHQKEILTHKEPEGCKAIVQANLSHLRKVSLDSPGILEDVDTPQDYNKLIN